MKKQLSDLAIELLKEIKKDRFGNVPGIREPDIRFDGKEWIKASSGLTYTIVGDLLGEINDSLPHLLSRRIKDEYNLPNLHLVEIERIFYDPKLMPGEDLPLLLMCEVPDKQSIKTRNDLRPYLKDRLVDLIKNSTQDFNRLTKSINNTLGLYNPWADYPKDLAETLLDSDYYTTHLFNDEIWDPEELWTSDEIYKTYNNYSIEDLVMLLDALKY